MDAERAREAPSDTQRGLSDAELPATRIGRYPARFWFVASLFLFSGVSALVYQLAWKRHLSLFFGSDVYSAAITLSAFMGGLALGSYIAERFADRVRRPLFFYGVLEIIIGAYALLFVTFLYGFEPLYEWVYLDFFASSPWLYNGLRMVIAGLVLLVPTSMMGATLPLIVASFVTNNNELGRYSGQFYSINTLGALSGVIVAGFLLFPLIGVTPTTEIAVAVNVVVGVGVILIDRLMPPVGNRLSTWRKPESSESYQPRPGYSEPLARITLVAICLSGLAALALEVVWMRILTQFYSGTVYSFAIMLVCFLFGIFYGSRRASRTVDQQADPVRVLAFLELGIGASVCVLAALTFFAPSIFGAILWVGTAITSGNFGFASVVAMFIVSVSLIAVTTILLGATFPIAVRVCTPAAELSGFGTGRVYAANTAGAILGALLGGFVLVPFLGSWNSLVVIGGIFAGIGFLLLRSADRNDVPAPSSGLSIRAKVAGLTGILIVTGAITLLVPKPIVLNYNRQTTSQPEVLYRGEGVAHTVDIVRNEKGTIIMLVDGNVEADTSYTQRRHFILKGHLPLVLHPEPRDVAVIGLGLGITLQATSRNPEVEQVQVVELSSEMVKAHQTLAGELGNLLVNPKISVRIDDGRNYIKMSDQAYDMVTADPIHPRISGVGYLYTREYYEAIKDRLKPGGIVCQWMPIYSVSPKSFDVAFRTFASVFQNATLWYVRGHALFVATSEPFKIDYAEVRARLEHPDVRDDLASIDIRGPEEFLSHLLMGPDEVKAYLAGRPDGDTLNTDDNAYLEYWTPFEFLNPTKDIVAGLLPYAGYDPALLTEISSEERQAVTANWGRRRERILPELDDELR